MISRSVAVLPSCRLQHDVVAPLRDLADRHEGSGSSQATVIGHNSQARLSQTEARRVLARVHGMTATEAL
jgi:hypothetical protein